MMKQWVIAGTLAGSLAFGGSMLAQQPAAQQPAGQQPTTKPSTPAQQPTTAEKGGQTSKPAAKKTRRAGAGGGTTESAAEHREPKTQPNTAADPSAPDAAMALGMVHIPRAVKADGKPLPAGSYQVRLTPDQSKPDAVGASEKLERWVEFVQKGSVKGREVVSIVPQAEIKLVQKDAPPAANGSKVQMLKGNDYMRVWISKGGNHYLIHLVPA
jgi:hypothetical protein